MEGISSSQGLHHVAQKLRKTTFPLNPFKLTGLPLRSGRVKSGALFPATTGVNLCFCERIKNKTTVTAASTTKTAMRFEPFLLSIFPEDASIVKASREKRIRSEERRVGKGVDLG